MSTIESNKDVVRRFVERVFEGLETSAVDELVADDFESHAYPNTPDDKSFLREATTRMAAALADIHFTIEDMIGEADRVAVRLTASGRQIGEFMGIPATNRSYKVGEIHIFRLADGRIAEHWAQVDTMGILRQLKGD
jgi:steroid delta-isomerase-like uncharacterized protein